MKIALNLNQKDTYSPDGEDQEKAIERAVLGCRRGDWEAKTRLIQTFMPLMTSLARKRSNDTAVINRHIEAGKEGLLYAVRRYKPTTNAKFQIFAPPHIEDAMDRVGRRSWLARLLGRS